MQDREPCVTIRHDENAPDRSVHSDVVRVKLHNIQHDTDGDADDRLLPASTMSEFVIMNHHV